MLTNGPPPCRPAPGLPATPAAAPCSAAGLSSDLFTDPGLQNLGDLVESGRTKFRGDIDEYLLRRFQKPSTAVDHVETMVAWMMRLHLKEHKGTMGLDLVINNTEGVCKSSELGLAGCYQAVSSILPSGSFLRVWSKDPVTDKMIPTVIDGVGRLED